jgi:hypothetical protein
MTNKEFYERALEQVKKDLNNKNISEERKENLGLYTALKSYQEQLEKIAAGEEAIKEL